VFLLISVTLSAICIWFLLLPEMTAFKPQPIHNLPFAAVTICPETKAKKSLIDFTGAYAAITNGSAKNLTDEQ
jgi:hypothetical protein